MDFQVTFYHRDAATGAFVGSKPHEGGASSRSKGRGYAARPFTKLVVSHAPRTDRWKIDIRCAARCRGNHCCRSGGFPLSAEQQEHES